MRIVPVITACIVAVLLFGIVIERERLLAFVADISPAAQTAETEETPDTELAETDGTDEAPAPDVPGLVKVLAVRSVAREVDSAVFLRGETEAMRQVNVEAETSGTIISTPLRRGAFVEADQLLCELDPGTRPANLAEAEARLAEAKARQPEVAARIPEAEARVEEAKARLDEALINANAASSLKEGGFASETRVKATEAAVRSAEAAVSSAEAGLKSARSGLESYSASIQSAEAAVIRARTEMGRLQIKAPFAGVLETDTAELGSLLQSGAPGGGLCATIVQLNPIKVVGYVPETQVSRVEVGARAGARLAGGRDVIGNVTFLSRSADPTTRTFRVEIHVDNADLSIRDGQTAEIAIEAEGAQAHLLPASVLTLNDDGALGVRTVSEDSSALFVPVTLLRDTREGVWLTGLDNQVDVIVVGQEFVTDGVPVAPSFEEVIQ